MPDTLWKWGSLGLFGCELAGTAWRVWKGHYRPGPAEAVCLADRRSDQIGVKGWGPKKLDHRLVGRASGAVGFQPQSPSSVKRQRKRADIHGAFLSLGCALTCRSCLAPCGESQFFVCSLM